MCEFCCWLHHVSIYQPLITCGLYIQKQLLEAMFWRTICAYKTIGAQLSDEYNEEHYYKLTDVSERLVGTSVCIEYLLCNIWKNQ